MRALGYSWWRRRWNCGYLIGGGRGLVLLRRRAWRVYGLGGGRAAPQRQTGRASYDPAGSVPLNMRRSFFVLFPAAMWALFCAASLPARASGSGATKAQTTAPSAAKPSTSSPAAHSTSTASHPTTTSAKKTTTTKRRRRTATRFVPKQKAPTADRITEIQTALARGGYYQGDPNGKWDANTVAALQKFQSANGIEATGKLDAPSLQKLGLGSDIAGVSAPKPPVPAGTVPQSATPPASSPAPGNAGSSSSQTTNAAPISSSSPSLASKPAQQ